MSRTGDWVIRMWNAELPVDPPPEEVHERDEAEPDPYDQLDPARQAALEHMPEEEEEQR